MGGLAVWVRMRMKIVNLRLLTAYCDCVSVAVNLCQGVQGYIQTGEEGYVITPAGGASLESEHEIMRLTGRGRDRAGREKRNTGGRRRSNLTGDEDMFTWYDVDLDEEMAEQDEQFSDMEWEGYVADKVWQVEQV